MLKYLKKNSIKKAYFSSKERDLKQPVILYKLRILIINIKNNKTLLLIKNTIKEVLLIILKNIITILKNKFKEVSTPINNFKDKHNFLIRVTLKYLYIYLIFCYLYILIICFFALYLYDKTIVSGSYLLKYHVPYFYFFLGFYLFVYIYFLLYNFKKTVSYTSYFIVIFLFFFIFVFNYDITFYYLFG